MLLYDARGQAACMGRGRRTYGHRWYAGRNGTTSLCPFVLVRVDCLLVVGWSNGAFVLRGWDPSFAVHLRANGISVFGGPRCVLRSSLAGVDFSTGDSLSLRPLAALGGRCNVCWRHCSHSPRATNKPHGALRRE